MLRRGFWLSSLSSFASGVAVFLAAPDFNLWPLAWIALVPLFFAISRAEKGGHALLFGFATGLATNVGGFYWIMSLLERFAFLPRWVATILLLALASYQALVFVIFAGVVRKLSRSFRLPMAVLAPVVLVSIELVFPMIFPWYMAITQAWQRPVIQIAELGGPLAVTALIVMANGAIYDAFHRRLAAPLVAFGIVIAALGYGQLRIGQIEARRERAPQLNVGVVQGNISFDDKGLENPILAAEQLAAQQARSRELEQAGADLLLWTESSYPYVIDRAREYDFPDLRRIRVGLEKPLIFGALTWSPGEEFPYNSALFLSADGAFASRQDKVYLLMFGEYIPGVETFSWIRNLVPESAAHFARGRSVTTFPFQTENGSSIRIGPMICYEDILPSFGRRLGKLHPHLLVNLTNDAWFGDSTEPWQHLALSVFRAVELRTDLVRAVNTGVSAFISATGAVYAKTYSIDPAKNARGADKILARVALVEGGHTPFVAMGDVFGIACVVVTLCLLVATRRRSPRAVEASAD